MKVSLKPNLVAAKPPELGATTHAAVAEGVILYLHSLGVRDIEIIESAWLGDDTKRAYKVCGYTALKEKYGVPLYDLKDDKTVPVKAGEYTFEVCKKALDTGFLINLPVLKAHCQTTLTCCLKNLKGCIPDREKRRFHAIGLHRPIAYLNQAIPTHFCVVDGICGDLDFEEGGNPVTRNLLMAGRDPVTVDSYAAALIGYKSRDIEHLRLAAELGVGRLYGDATPVVELNGGEKPPMPQANGGAVRRLAKQINEDGACSACYAALVHALHRSDSMPRDPIAIGQGFRGKAGRLGCGSCTAGHERHIPGCPPKAVDIITFLSGV